MDPKEAQSLEFNHFLRTDETHFSLPLPVVISTPSAHTSSLTDESGWESRGCCSEKPSTVSCLVLPLFRFLLLRWCECALAPRADKKRNDSRLSRQHKSYTHTHIYVQVMYVYLAVCAHAQTCLVNTSS